MKVKIKKVNENAVIPFYSTKGSAGMDISACIEINEMIDPGEVKMISTGLSIALPIGYECQVRSRSGLAAKNGIFALNSPGTIDSDYRGEIKVILANFSKVPFEVENGMRIAQLVIAQYEHIAWEEVNELNETERGEGGFGSTGIN
jgi:dUTP pyrophosphatase